MISGAKTLLYLLVLNIADEKFYYFFIYGSNKIATAIIDKSRLLISKLLV